MVGNLKAFFQSIPAGPQRYRCSYTSSYAIKCVLSKPNETQYLIDEGTPAGERSYIAEMSTQNWEIVPIDWPIAPREHSRASWKPPKAALSLLLLAILLSTPARALDTDKLAHFGLAYVGQDLGQRFCQRALRLDKFDSVILTAFTMGFFGLVKEATDRQPNGGDLAAQAVGQVLRISFEFEW